MKTKFFFLLAAMLLMSVSAFAQSSETPLKGDVNGDGVVDVADINAIIAIMKNGGGTGEETKYYWYVGQTDPNTMSTIDPIVTDTSSPGWRYIGTSVGTYTMSNPLYDATRQGRIVTGEIKSTVYVALPNNTIKVRNSDGGELGYQYDGTKTINNVTYYIYSAPNMKTWIGILF